MERNIEIIAVIALIAAGLSQIYAQRVWMGYYHWMAEAGVRGVRIHGLIFGVLGILIVRMHSVWHGLGMVLTYFGGLLAAQGALFLFIPSHGLRTLVVFDDTIRPGLLRYTGIALLIVAAILSAHLIVTRG